jgi:hypothetical protein
MLARTAPGTFALLLLACGDGGPHNGADIEPPSTDAGETSRAEGSSSAIASDTGTGTETADPHTDGTSSSDAAGGSSEDSSGDEPLLDFDAVPWRTGDEIGYGIAYKDLGDPEAHHAFIGYAGYPFPLDAAQSWVSELYHARLRELGVRHVYAVQGPADVPYSQLEIGNSSIASALPDQLGPEGFVLVAAHSSGTYVSHELFHQLVDGFDPEGATFDRVVYFNLDGGLAGIDGAVLGHLRRAYFVSAYDGSTGTGAANLDAMVYAGDMWSREGGYVEVDASTSGCAAGAPWCLHMAVINSLPHDPWDSDVVDYFDFENRPVVTAYIDAKAEDAGLVP